MDQFPVEINIDDYWNSQIHAWLAVSLFLTNPAFYYISAGMVKSFSLGDVSMMILLFVQLRLRERLFYEHIIKY